MIRDEGSQKVLMTAAATPLAEALARLRATPLPTDAVARVLLCWRFVFGIRRCKV